MGVRFFTTDAWAGTSTRPGKRNNDAGLGAVFFGKDIGLPSGARLGQLVAEERYRLYPQLPTARYLLRSSA